MRRLLEALTVRGRAFVAAGVAAVACGVLIPETDLLRIGALLMALPLLSVFGAGRARYRLSCVRRLVPARLPAGQSAELTIRLANISRLRTGLLLAEDAVPYELGRRPRFVFHGIGGGGSKEFRYKLGSDTRGRYTIGPLQVRVADSFGLVSITRAFTGTSTLTVTPRIIPLARPPLGGNWLGDSEHGKRSISASGDDDVAPREYRTGDGLHRVHWRSTARYGELMVRREEHQWRNSASVFLDTRRSAHTGTGPASTFEFAVSAAASIGAHLSGEGFRARLITDAGEIAPRGTFNDTLLDMLAVITPSHASGFRTGTSELARAGGQLIAVIGRLSVDDARQLAASRRGNAPAMALLLAVSGWTSGRAGEDTAQTAEVLSAAGWRVAVVTSGTPLATAWQQLHRPFDPADRPVPVGGLGGDPR